MDQVTSLTCVAILGQAFPVCSEFVERFHCNLDLLAVIAMEPAVNECAGFKTIADLMAWAGLSGAPSDPESAQGSFLG